MQKRIIEDFTGVKREIECWGCYSALAGENAPGFVLQTETFHAHQDQEVPIPGFVILATKRHAQSLDELTEAEATEFIALARRIRQAMRKILNIQKISLVQEEQSRHFHLWLFPHYEWMTEEKFGKRIQSAVLAMKYAEENMKTPEIIAEVKEAAEKLRIYLKN